MKSLSFLKTGAAVACVAAMLAASSLPASADGGRIAAGVAGGLAGGVLLGTLLAQPRPAYAAPAPVYVAPAPGPVYYDEPVVVERPVVRRVVRARAYCADQQYVNWQSMTYLDAWGRSHPCW